MSSTFRFATNQKFDRAGKSGTQRVPRGGLGFVAFAMLGLALITLGTERVANGQNPNRVRTYSQNDVERLIKDVEQSSKEFRRDFDTWLDNSSLDGQAREDRYNRQVNDLTKELGNLRSNFNRRNDWWLARSDMQRVLNAATVVNTAMNNREAARGLERQWSRLRRNINMLSQAFNLPQVGTNYVITQPIYPGSGGGGRGGGGRNCPDGTYRGYTNTGESELTIANNGVASIRSMVSGAVYSGRCDNGILYFEWGAFNLRRDGRGLSTTEVGNEANRTTYQRVSGSGDYGQNYPQQGYPQQGYPQQGYPQPAGNVPNWAVGTFRGMTNSGEADLTIEPGGVATIRSLSTGQTFGGSYSNGVLTFEWGSFRLTRDGSGIRTVDINNQQSRTSYRRIN